MMRDHTVNKFNEIASNKANLGSIAEKAFRNVQIKVSGFNKDKETHYFLSNHKQLKPIHYCAIGHTF